MSVQPTVNFSIYYDYSNIGGETKQSNEGLIMTISTFSMTVDNMQ